MKNSMECGGNRLRFRIRMPHRQVRANRKAEATASALHMVFALLLALPVFAATVTVDHNPVLFRAATDDAAQHATATLLSGKPDPNGAQLTALTDGYLPTDADQPSANVFFAADTWGGRVRLDLGRVVDIAAIDTYSWHPGSRGPQVYKVYGSGGGGAQLNPAPLPRHDPASVGWKLLAYVDTRPAKGEGGGQYVAHVDGDVGRHQYLLFDFFETESDDAWGNTFYGEIDVLERGKEMPHRIRTALLESWAAYVKYAWGWDELQPLSKCGKNWHSESLLMTPVDSYDTLVLLGAKAEAEQARKLILERLSFDKDISVKNFEITIRLLGGLLSAYELSGDERFLRLADDLGTRLLPAFDSPTGMPYMYVNLKTGKTSGAKSNPAEIGTLFLEFGTLAKLTKKPIYYDKAKKALVALYDRRSKLGLVGEEIDVETGKWVGHASHVGGGIDSYYEYLLKGWLLFGDKDCQRMWRESVRALNAHLADNAPSGLWYGQVDMYSGKRTASEFGALHAFLPAVLALGGDLDRARKLEDACFKMWNLHGIEPEVLNYREMKVVHPGYQLRPEIMESAWTLYVHTKDPRYQEMGRVFFNDLVKHCRTDAGYTTLRSVVTKEKADHMPSYFLAETLKYLYLLFAPETLDPSKVVFNTEAHPFRR
jgi:ER degradation enhancer, mannosidase alpha-like 2